jgi:hypothetical protein
LIKIVARLFSDSREVRNPFFTGECEAKDPSVLRNFQLSTKLIVFENSFSKIIK